MKNECSTNTIHMPQPQNAPVICKEDIEAYLFPLGWLPMPQSMIPDALVYYHHQKSIGVVFMDDSIEMKPCPANAEINGAQILMNWTPTKYFKGWDGRNEFVMMMVLHFLDAVKMYEVNKAVRQRINMEHLLAYIPSTYGAKAEKVNNDYPGILSEHITA